MLFLLTGQKYYIHVATYYYNAVMLYLIFDNKQCTWCQLGHDIKLCSTAQL